MNKTGTMPETVISYSDCLKDGVLTAFILNSILTLIILYGNVMYMGDKPAGVGVVVGMFFLGSLILATIIYTPVIMLIKRKGYL